MKRIISILCVLTFSFFPCFSNVIANELNENFDENSKPNYVKPDKNDKTNLSNSTNEDIFGDEQAFPFIAGLGKNAAH